MAGSMSLKLVGCGHIFWYVESMRNAWEQLLQTTVDTRLLAMLARNAILIQPKKTLCMWNQLNVISFGMWNVWEMYEKTVRINYKPWWAQTLVDLREHAAIQKTSKSFQINAQEIPESLDIKKPRFELYFVHFFLLSGIYNFVCETAVAMYEKKTA